MKFLLLTRRRLPPHVSTIQDFSLRILPYWIAAALTALASVLFTHVFALAEDFSFRWSAWRPELAFIVIPLSLVLSAELARRFSPFAAGSGIPQLIAAVDLSREPHPLLSKLLGLPVIVIKFIGASLCVAGGGITGREGPMLQISAGIFNWVQRRWPSAKAKLDPQSMILAGGAAGLASAFNTPLGGVIFAIEELAKVHVSHVRTTIFHSVIISGLLAQAILGNYLYLGETSLNASGFAAILPLALAAALIGALGALFGVGVVKANDWRVKQTPRAKTFMTALCGLAVTGIFYIVGTNGIGSGRNVIVGLLTDPATPAGVELALARGFANYFTYVGGVIGGIFAPALSTGAAFGSWMSRFVAESNPQTWILAGMIAFLTGVTRTPFTSLILVLEMTSSHEIILDLMVVAVLAQGAARLIDPVSFYEHMAGRIRNTSQNQGSS